MCSFLHSCIVLCPFEKKYVIQVGGFCHFLSICVFFLLYLPVSSYIWDPSSVAYMLDYVWYYSPQTHVHWSGHLLSLLQICILYKEKFQGNSTLFNLAWKLYKKVLHPRSRRKVVQGKYNIKTVIKSIHMHDIFQLKMT